MGGCEPINPIIIKPGESIGAISAEKDDIFLFKCFVDHPSLSVICDHESPKSFLLGRTGVGKTAILRMMAKKNENVSEIDLHGMAMDYVANSDIIRFLESLGVDLDLIFQVLWKHVLCLEYIRSRFSIQNEDKSKHVFSTLKSLFDRDDSKKSALDYLSKWEKDFWITMDVNIKEIIEKFETDASAEFGAEIQKFNAKAGYARSLSVEKKSQLIARAKKVVNPTLLAELSKVLNLLSEYDKRNTPHKFYILIDQIDERWVDDSIRFQLIRALIECLKSFGKIRALKIVVTMRIDVLERVLLEGMNTGEQREKYDDYFLRIIWNKDQLVELIEKRIKYMYKRQYTSDNVCFGDIFQHNVGGKKPFDYMLERTLYRPRDIISFVNLSLDKAQGNAIVNSKHIKSAEPEYSRIRLQALESEWENAIPSLGLVLRNISGKRERFVLSELTHKDFLDSIVLLHEEATKGRIDPFSEPVKIYLDNQSQSSAEKLAKTIAAELYRIGVIGIKLSPDDPYIYSYRDTPILNHESISITNKIQIHPMLHCALNINSIHKK